MKLKPCPFCGDVKFIELDYNEHTEKSRPFGYRYVGRVKCVRCGVHVTSSGFCDSAESAYHAAAERWNRRTSHAID